MASFKEATGKSIKDSWWAFHKKNPKVFELFCDYVEELIKSGVTKCSSKLIINRIRWEILIKTKDKNSVYKINDAYTAYYARLFIHYNPKHKDFFETRKIRSK